MDDFIRAELRKQSYIPHASSMMQYNRCRRKWALQQLYEPQEEHKALTFGTIFHKALELVGNTPVVNSAEIVKQAIKESADDVAGTLEEDDVVLLEKMLQYYLEYWLTAPENEWFRKLKFLVVEEKFALPMLEGRLDALVEDEDGQIWVLDYKTRAQLSGPGTFEMDLQMTAYTWAAKQLFGKPVEGVIVLQFLKKEPKGLRVLKSGELSAAKNQRVSPLIVQQQIEHLPEEVQKKYVDFVFYDPDEDPFIRAVRTYRNENQLESFARHLKHHHTEIGLLLTRYIHFTPNFTRDCLWDCPFRGVCIAYEDGFDWLDILRGSFKRREVM